MILLANFTGFTFHNDTTVKSVCAEWQNKKSSLAGRYRLTGHFHGFPLPINNKETGLSRLPSAIDQRDMSKPRRMPSYDEATSEMTPSVWFPLAVPMI